MAWITVTQFAKEINKTPRYIRYLITKGKIPKDAIKPKIKDGRNLLVNREKALKGIEGSVQKKREKQKQEIGNKKAKVPIEDAEEKKKVLEAAGITVFATLTEAQKFKESYHGALKKLEFEQKSGELISAIEVEREYFNIARTVRDSLLNIPSRISAILAAESDKAKTSEILTNEIRQVLEILSK